MEEELDYPDDDMDLMIDEELQVAPHTFSSNSRAPFITHISNSTSKHMTP